MSRPRIEPSPPRVSGPIPVVRGGAGFLRDPTGFLSRARAEQGDTFALDMFGFELLFLFSPVGLRSLYALKESDASFTEATRTLLGFKLPAELTSGDMRMFHHLFGREKREGYLAHIRGAVDEELGRLRADGELDVFPHMKRLVHVVGFRSWAGREASSPRYLSRLVALFERLDPEEAFVRPARTFVTLLTRKALERRALSEIADILGEIWSERQRRGAREGDMLEALHDLYRDEPPAERHARVARDVVVLHLASLSNLYAAMAWTLVNLLDRPDHLARAVSELRDVEARRGPAFLEDSSALDELRFLGEVAYESIRHAQRSITLRKVLQRCEVDDGSRVYTVEPGVYIATLLSVSNGLHGTMDRYDPAHYERDRIAPSAALPTKESVSTFGHGIHTCPGQRFAVSAMKIVVARHLQALDLTPRFRSPRPKTSQIGAVGRAAAPCLAHYHRR